MESRDAEGWTPLASAAFNGRKDLCQFLVGKGCTLCLNAAQKEQLKPNFSCRVHLAAVYGDKTTLQLLLDMGADINERNSFGETALLQAVCFNHLSCVKLLTGRGADATILANEDTSVLHRAVRGLTDSEMMRFLLDDVVGTRNLVDKKDSFGETPLHYCSYVSYRSPVVQIENAKMLVEAGASLTIRNDLQRTPYECARERRYNEHAEYLWSQLSPKQQALEKLPPSSRKKFL
ncbi:ankyrin [Terfezia boudieri ATCC MYA-4762]|uniref:Ankyrin n=1 Tax=Terfezia boudieri ATCC MYA-4762 TaxID=1051890 RepID=A0A3N4L9E7_9PEZI|nr:ankyrin [Terfezia boudieri ATCC MYA-4762]